VKRKAYRCKHCNRVFYAPEHTDRVFCGVKCSRAHNRAAARPSRDSRCDSRCDSRFSGPDDGGEE
jgi:hypothetical protein